MHLCSPAPHRMGTKICLLSLTFFLLVAFQGSKVKGQTPADEMESLSPTGRRNETTDVDSSLASQTQQTITSSPLTFLSTGREEVRNSTAPKEKTTVSQTMLTSAPAAAVTSFRSTTEKTTKRAAFWDPKWDQGFTYDYTSLRTAGLSLAALLFIMGIMVISCGRICRLPRCHKRSSKSYRVAQG